MKLEKIDVKPLEIEEEEYRPLLSEYFTAKPAVRQNRAIRGKARYIVFQNSDGIYAIEERGDWNDDIEFSEENQYRWIYRDNIGKVNEEKMSWQDARELLSDHSKFSL